MRLVVVDYVANLGGGVRFSCEVLRGLRQRLPQMEVEVVSHGDALERYSTLLREIPGVRLTSRPPFLEAPLRTVRRIPRTTRLLGWLGFSSFHFWVSPNVLGGGDITWFPWIHRHRVFGPVGRRVVGSFHDTIMLERDDVLPPSMRSDELATTRRWFASSARLVVSSRATAQALTRLHLIRSSGEVELVPVAWDHFVEPVAIAASVPDEPWTTKPFLLCPANTSPHKNHEVLLSGAALANSRIAVALTGGGTSLSGEGRGRVLREHASRCGLRAGETLHALGYVSDDRYRYLLERAWAVVMPTLAEGGGSFPVLEAMNRGVPVICSDIPVMREQVERTGGELLWFDPRSPESLAARIDELAAGYPDFRRRAGAQRDALTIRRWSDVAQDYVRIFETVLRRAPGAR